MIQDFWLGVLAAATFALALAAVSAATVAAVSIRWLARYASVRLDKSPDGEVIAKMSVRAATTVRDAATGGDPK